MKLSHALSLVALLASASVASAHAPLTGSVPADGASGPAPAAFTLTFGHEARLTSLTLRPENGDARPVPGVARELSAEHRVPAPALKPGRYELAWRAAAPDGHVMSGTIHFTVVVASAPRPAAGPSATR